MTSVSGQPPYFESSITIPCLVLSYGLDEVNIRSVNGIVACDPRLLVDVVHNPSPHENGEFLAHVFELLSAGSIRSITVLDKNISNNAMLLALLDRRQEYSRSTYIVITDCDVLPSLGLLDEQISILGSHPEILGCGMRVDPSQWSDSLSVKEICLKRFNSSEREAVDYLDVQGGVWMLMLRTAEFFDIIDSLVQARRRLTDGNIGLFASLLFSQKIVSTLSSIGIELNRAREDGKSDRREIAASFGDFSPEPENSGYSIWNHDLICAATKHFFNGTSRYSPIRLPPARARHRGSLSQDPVFNSLVSHQHPFDVASIVVAAKSIRPSHSNRLYFVVCDPARKQLPASISYELRNVSTTIIFLTSSDKPHRPYGIRIRLADFGLSLLKMKCEAALDALSLILGLVSADCSLTGICFRHDDHEALCFGSLSRFASQNNLLLRSSPCDKTKIKFELLGQI